jgi:ABC-2 type transport system permease protein
VRRFAKQALVIARRDFTAIVLTPTFLIFLFAPLFMLTVATLGGLGAAQVVETGRERAVVLAPATDIPAVREAERQLRGIAGVEPGPPNVSIETAEDDPERRARALLASNDVAAVLWGVPERPMILHTGRGLPEAVYLDALARSATSPAKPVLRALDTPPKATRQERTTTALGAVLAMFFLSLLLASQAISMLAEERNNKVIEILAAAVPLEAVFLGKLIGMLGVALLFVSFWGAIVGSALVLGLGGLNLGTFAPAGGLTAFAALFVGYFVLAFLLLGAVFLGVGAQASTMREIQMLSLPITILQVAMFALASAGAGAPDSAVGIASAVFPFSSPFAMAARAATGVPAWQHVAAFAWQLLWLALTVTVAARLFRRGVLKSGGARRS